MADPVKSLLSYKSGFSLMLITGAITAPQRVRKRKWWATALKGLIGYRRLIFFRGGK